MGSENALQRQSSWVSHPAEPVRSQSREHSGLMSWPEHFYKGKAHQLHPTEGTNSLSAKAMELSIFGSMVHGTYRCYRSFSGTAHSTTHSLSYPRVPSGATPTRPLVSAQSEGGSLGKRLRGKVTKSSPAPQVPISRRKVPAKDDSSDESGAEEIIIGIDSPSNISFPQASIDSLTPHEK